MALPGLYIHIPFCRSKCAYCSFYSSTNLDLIPAFLASLKTEMTLYRERFPAIDTVYLGGGTPSVLAACEVETILGEVRKTFVLADGVEITVEVNPGDATPAYLRDLHRCGVNRLNIGIQSFDDDVLAFLRRRHTGRQAAETIVAAREAGFANLGLDLIYGLPLDTSDRSSVPRHDDMDAMASGIQPALIASPVYPTGNTNTSSRGRGGVSSANLLFPQWLDTLETALSFEPEHLSCYELTIEAGVPLAAMIGAGGLSLPGEDIQCRYFLRTSEVLEEAGYIHYEVSNFAREERFRSRHNGKYWNHTPYLGLGPAAHSFSGTVRWWNHRDVALYIRSVQIGERPVEAQESLSREQLRLEALSLGIRTVEGINILEYYENYGHDLSADRGDIIDRLLAQGYLRRRGGRIVLTRQGLAVADAVAGLLA